MAMALIGIALAPAQGAGAGYLVRTRPGKTQAAQPLSRFDFTNSDEVKQWLPTHDVSGLEAKPGGLLIHISGSDPYIHGPARDLPANQRLWLRMRLKSDEGGMGQVFYFTTNTREEDSVRFPVKAGVWDEVRVPVPPLGPGTHFRIDPPGAGGDCLISSMSLEARSHIDEPAWPKPGTPHFRDAQVMMAGDLLLQHDGEKFGSYTVSVAGTPMACGNDSPLIGYESAGKVIWIDVQKSGRTATGLTSHKTGVGIDVRTRFTDPDGGRWEITQDFVPNASRNAIDVTTRVVVSQSRSIVYLPMLTLLPGFGSFGTEKGQGLFCGLEYLDNEPSSSEKDIEGPGHNRRVPDTLKITVPLMAIQARDRYIGLIWDKSSKFSALFDSPDRIFHSGAHVMGVQFPGSNGADREDGALLPYQGTVIPAGQSIELHATIIGGKGKSIVPAVQQYVALRGLPPVPSKGVDLRSYIALASSGWLDSKVSEGGLFRHAWPGGFGLSPAADAPVFMDWLASRTDDSALAKRLTGGSKEALARVGPGDYYGSGVSHVRFPVAPLLHGSIEENITRAEQLARSLLNRFDADGSVPFRQSPGGLDYGRTHFAKDADGLTAQVVMSFLEAAAFCGDRDLINKGIDKLRALDQFSNTVPRGAQTWEVPLHTPDILASAYLVRAYSLGYALTGERHFLDQARYWAWTGVPFLYLVPPTGEPVGLYATIPVLGATQWKAPNWMGLPVQWCGLVYSDALYRLIPYDPNGPWKRLADGITASGIQQSWPTGGKDRQGADRQGLLPDSFNLRAQTRNDSAINPGTLEANAIRLFGGPAPYGFHVFPRSRVLVHAPGEISNAVEGTGTLSFGVLGWSDAHYNVLVLGLPRQPRVFVNGIEDTAGRFEEKSGRLILSLKGSPMVELRWP